MKIEESSRPFCYHEKGIRILFVASDTDLEVELISYPGVNRKPYHPGRPQSDKNNQLPNKN